MPGEARDAQRKGDLDQVQKALELYKNDQNPQTYPSRIDYQTVIVSGGYMKEFPIDPTHRQVESARLLVLRRLSS